jgi:carbamoyltransferase
MTKSVFCITDTYHDSSYCFYSPSEVHHVEVERFSRVKLERMNAIVAMLEIEGKLGLQRLKSCSAFAIVEGDFLTPWIRTLLQIKSSGLSPNIQDLTHSFIETCETAKGHIDYFDGNISHEVNAIDYEPLIFEFLSWLVQPEIEIYICGHHLSHAANSFFSSPHRGALTITLDGGGYDFLDNDWRKPRADTYGSVFACRDNEVRPLHWIADTSIGACWARVTTQVLKMNFGEEGTLMAMAAYGDPMRLSHLLQQDIPWSSAAFIETEGGKTAYQKWLDEAGSSITDEQGRFDFAASLQMETEIRVKKILDDWITQNHRVICLCGGVFLNCQVTGKIRKWYPWLEDVFVPPAPYDGGLRIGAAQFIVHQVQQQDRKLGITSRFPFGSGRSYSRFEILTACRSAKISLVSATPNDVVARLKAGEVGCLFSAQAESGRRALGNRSIIADPRNDATKDRLNNVIKKRKPFRPFAPFVLAEETSNWFDC